MSPTNGQAEATSALASRGLVPTSSSRRCNGEVYSKPAMGDSIESPYQQASSDAIAALPVRIFGGNEGQTAGCNTSAASAASPPPKRTEVPRSMSDRSPRSWNEDSGIVFYVDALDGTSFLRVKSSGPCLKQGLVAVDDVLVAIDGKDIRDVEPASLGQRFVDAAGSDLCLGLVPASSALDWLSQTQMPAQRLADLTYHVITVRASAVISRSSSMQRLPSTEKLAEATNPTPTKAPEAYSCSAPYQAQPQHAARDAFTGVPTTASSARADARAAQTALIRLSGSEDGSVDIASSLLTQPSTLPRTRSAGVGIIFSTVEVLGRRLMRVKRLVPSGPAMDCKSEVRVKDVLVSIDGKDVRGLEPASLSNLFLGMPGTLVRLGFVPASALSHGMLQSPTHLLGDYMVYFVEIQRRMLESSPAPSPLPSSVPSSRSSPPLAAAESKAWHPEPQVAVMSASSHSLALSSTSHEPALPSPPPPVDTHEHKQRVQGAVGGKQQEQEEEEVETGARQRMQGTGKSREAPASTSSGPSASQSRPPSSVPVSIPRLLLRQDPTVVQASCEGDPAPVLPSPLPSLTRGILKSPRGGGRGESPGCEEPGAKEGAKARRSRSSVEGYVQEVLRGGWFVLRFCFLWEYST